MSQFAQECFADEEGLELLSGEPAGDDHRDLDDIAAQRSTDGRELTIIGTWRSHQRLLVVVRDQSDHVSAEIVATKGELVAQKKEFGNRGELYGNSRLVARVLHFAVYSLAAAGFAGIRLEPVDRNIESARAHLREMGFEDGVLLFENAEHLSDCFEYILTCYGDANRGLPPTPFAFVVSRLRPGRYSRS